MSGVLKSGGSNVQAFAAGARAKRTATVEPVPSPLDHARREIEALRGALAAQREAAANAEAAAREAGWEDGRKATEDGRKTRETKLADALDAARRVWDDRLASLDALAAMLARGVLARIFTDSDDLAEQMGRAISRRVDTLKQEAVVAIRVSPRDFPDAAALHGLAERGGVTPALCIADPALGAGECRFDLRLGHIDVGPGAQWRMIDAFLESLAGRAGAA